MPFLPPNQQRQSTEGKHIVIQSAVNICGFTYAQVRFRRTSSGRMYSRTETIYEAQRFEGPFQYDTGQLGRVPLSRPSTSRHNTHMHTHTASLFTSSDDARPNTDSNPNPADPIQTVTDSGEGIFTARCYASAVLAMGLWLSVSVSVTSRSSTKTNKHRSTQKHHTIAQELQFSEAKDLREIRPGWGGSKSATFRK